MGASTGMAVVFCFSVVMVLCLGCVGMGDPEFYAGLGSYTGSQTV